MQNGGKRKLDMPKWHIPYLEKHRINELFHEIARELVIQQPPDHVLFMKQILEQAVRCRDTARIVILPSPRVNVQALGSQLANRGKHVLITEANVLQQMHIGSRSEAHEDAIVILLNKITSTREAKEKGWVMIDCIKTEAEAKRLLQIGIIPTHVFHLIPPFIPDFNKLLYCNVVEGWPEYRRRIVGIRTVFKHKLIEVPLYQQCFSEVVEKLLELAKVKKSTGAPMTPRIVLLGPRGSGRRSQAEMLVASLNVIHVDFTYILCQAWISGTELGEKLKRCGNLATYQSDLLAQVLNKRILEPDCLQNGWVLTGFPYTVVDFKFIDMLDMPPNRVVFLEADMSICRERIISKRINVNTGSTTDLKQISDDDLVEWKKELKIEPKSMESIVQAEFKFYCEHYGTLRKYCGDSAIVINTDQPQRHVHETVLAFLANASPAFPARSPCDTESECNDDEQLHSKPSLPYIVSIYISQIGPG